MSFNREKQVNRDLQVHLEFRASRVLVDHEVQMVEGALLGPLVCLDPRGRREVLEQMVLQESLDNQVLRAVLETEVLQGSQVPLVQLEVVVQVVLRERGVILANQAKRVLLDHRV